MCLQFLVWVEYICRFRFDEKKTEEEERNNLNLYVIVSWQFVLGNTFSFFKCRTNLNSFIESNIFLAQYRIAQ